MNAMLHTHLPAALPVDLLARVGEAVASAATEVQGAGTTDQLQDGLARLEQLGLQLQAAARVLAAPGGARPETVELGVATLQACSEWSGALARAGIAWSGPQRSCAVQTNPAVLKQMIDLAFGHALTLGRRIEVEVALRRDPAQKLLEIAVSRPDGELFAALPGEASEWQWALLSLLARHAGVSAEREVQARAVVLRLGFDVFGAVELEALPEPASLPQIQVPPGCRVLLLEPHEPTRLHAERLMLAAGVKVTAVASIDQARGALAHGAPECLVTGIETDDPACAPFVADLRAIAPHLRMLELSAQPHVFATSLPEAGRPARVARDDLARNLVLALAQELGTPR